MSGWMGIDLSQYDLDDPIEAVESNAIQSAVEAFSSADPAGGAWTGARRRALGWHRRDGPRCRRLGVRGGRRAAVLGRGDRRRRFNLAYAITPGTFADVVEHLVPELQRRGAYQREYTPGTLRHKLLGRGDRLPTDHRGASFRQLAPLQAAA